MNVYLLMCYITGSLCVLIYSFLYIIHSRKIVLYLKALSDIMTSINLLFIYFYTKDPIVFASVATNAIATVREILFSFRGKSKAIDNIAWPISFSALFLLSLIFTYKSPLSLLPALGSVISTFAVYMIDQRMLKAGMIINGAIYSTYYAITAFSEKGLTLFSLLCAFAGMVSAIIGFVISIKKHQKTSHIPAN